MKRSTYFVLCLVALSIFAVILFNPSKNMANQYLENKGYTVIEYKGGYTYKLLQEDLVTLPYMYDWGVQDINIGEYIDKTVKVEQFIIKNHPLDVWKCTDKNGEITIKSKNRTCVDVFIVDKKVIGGISLPDYDIPNELGYRLGGYEIWSLEGKTLEEVHKTTYEKWYKNWMNKFRKK